MMSREENCKITGVGAISPLHESLSRYWYPVMQAGELADRHTRKVRLLGDNYVVARQGESLIALDEMCPHRQASLTLARVEDQGLRCIYHGWVMNREGRVVETPNEREQGGRQQVRVRAPQVREAGGLIWMNVCVSDDERAPFPDLAWIVLPESQRVIVSAHTRSNWVQALEGAIDSSHSSHLHSDEIVSQQAVPAGSLDADGRALERIARPSADRHPRIKIRDTDCGFIYGAIRTPTHDAERLAYVRATAYAFPSAVSFPASEVMRTCQIFVPEDDGHTHFFYIRYSETESLDHDYLLRWSGMLPGKDLDEHGRLRLAALPGWGQDRAAMASGASYTGLRGIAVQDIVVQESMGAVVDRSREHLGAADLAIVHFRRTLLAAAQGEGAGQSGFARGMSYASLRARDGLVPLTQDWSALYPSDEIHWRETD